MTLREPEHAHAEEPVAPEPRRVDEIDPERLRAAFDEALVLVGARLPQRVYPSTKLWRVVAMAWVARMAGTLGAMRLLIGTGHRSEATTLLRSLWEHVVTFCWYMIDPERRLQIMRDHSLAGQRTLHEEVAAYGVTLLTEHELARTQGKKRLPKLITLAAEVDNYRGPKIKGFRVQPASGSKDLLTLSGLYIGLYRIASRSAHPSIEGLDCCIDVSGRHPLVRLEDDASSYPFGMALPVLPSLSSLSRCWCLTVSSGGPSTTTPSARSRTASRRAHARAKRMEQRRTSRITGFCRVQSPGGPHSAQHFSRKETVSRRRAVSSEWQTKRRPGVAAVR